MAKDELESGTEQSLFSVFVQNEESPYRQFVNVIMRSRCRFVKEITVRMNFSLQAVVGSVAYISRLVEVLFLSLSSSIQ